MDSIAPAARDLGQDAYGRIRAAIGFEPAIALERTVADIAADRAVLAEGAA